MIKLLSESVPAARGARKSEPPDIAVVDLDEQRRVMEKRCQLETLGSLLTKRTDLAFPASLFPFHNSDCINITVPLHRDLISKTLLPPNRRQRL